MPEENFAKSNFDSMDKTAEVKPSRSITFLVILLIILAFSFLLLGFVLGSEYFSKNQNKVVVPSAKSIKLPVNEASGGASIANWKTYANEKYGYEIKSPETWYLYKPTEITAYSKNTVGFWPKKGEGEVQGVWVTIHDDKIQFSGLNDWWEKYKKLSTVNFNAEDHNVSHFQIDGIDAIKDETRNSYQSRPYITIYAYKNGEIYEINTNIMVSEQIDYPLFFQILSTFKFTEKGQPSPTTTVSACSSNDQSFCDFVTKIRGQIDSKNYSAIADEQKINSVTCDPNGMFVQICEGVAAGEKRTGYSTGRVQSEGSIISKVDLTSMFNNSFNSGEFTYHGSLNKDAKGVVVYLNNTKDKLFAIFALKEVNGWIPSMELTGAGQSIDVFVNMDPSILE
jgi:hypothetical protein